jgi:formylglycine-generating enzyme required for sulfatase activity
VVLTRGFVISPTEVTRAQWRATGFPDPSPPGAPECDDCPVGRINWYEALAYVNALSRKADLPECYRLENCVGTIGAGCPPPNDSSPAAQEWDLYGCAGEARFVAQYYICEWPVHRYPDRYSCPGYRLPTAAEWQYAARAGTTTATFNGDPAGNWGECLEEEVLEPIAWYCHNSDDRAHPVGRKQPNPWGLYDMIGNHVELVDHIESGFPLDVDEGHPPPLVDPVGPTELPSQEYERFGLRGGAWAEWWDSCSYTASLPKDSSGVNRLAYFGFRPVRTVFEPAPDGGARRTTEPDLTPATD